MVECADGNERRYVAYGRSASIRANSISGSDK